MLLTTSMKNYFLFLAICFSATFYAQDLANKVPKNSPFALCINGKNLNDKVAIKTIQEYPWIQNLLEKELKFLPKDLTQTGIDFASKHYQYYTGRDTVMNYVVLIPLTNAVQFEEIIHGKYGDSLKIKKQNNYSTISTSKNHHLAWNDKFAVSINAYYTTPYKNPYSEPYSDLAIMDSTQVVYDAMPVTDSVAVSDYTVVEEVAPAPAPKKAKTSKKTKTSKKSKNKKGKKTKKVAEPTKEELYQIQLKEEAEWEEKERKLKEIEDKKNDSIERLKIAPVVELIFKETFDSSKQNTAENSLIFKNNNPKSDFYAFADLDLLSSQFLSNFAGNNAALLGIYKNGLFNSSYHINGFFDKDKIRLQQVVTPKSEEIKKACQEMFDSKIDKNLLNYVGNKILGYYSISMDTEALMNYEYSVMKNTLNSVYKAYSKEAKANEADVIVDAVALLLDEKAIADLIPGSAIFVLHDLKKVEREYITYDYDENYEQKENKSTKEEIQPDFTFLANTRNESFVNKLLKLPLDKNKVIGIDYQLTNGYYTIHFEKDNILENIYFGLKNGVLIVTTLKENVENLIQQKSIPFSADFKKSITKNNSSAWLDVQKIIAVTKPESEKEVNNNYWEIALKNAGEFNFESKFKDGAITSEAVYTIKGNHTNSLQYFLNVLNELYTESKKEVIVTE